MAILNYSTKVDPHRSVNEIQKILGAKGCRSISIDYDATGNPQAVLFLLVVGDNEVYFRLPRNAEGVFAALKKAKNAGELNGMAWRDITRERSEWISWRIVKDWVAAQLALIEAGQAQMAEVFLPYAVTNQLGQTMFQRFLESNTKQLAEVNE